MKARSSFEDWWPLYAVGAFVYLFLHLLYALDWLPEWVTWIPIILMAVFATSVWLLRNLTTKKEKEIVQ